MTKRAIVLAAGTGSRLGEPQIDLPKPLRRVAGVPLLVRVLRTLQSVGIREAVVVTGFEGDRVRRALMSEPSLGLNLLFANNGQYLKKNGVSLLAASEFLDRECILTMSDHLYSPELVYRLMAAELPEDGCALAVDRDIERCFDIDDATKVRSKSGKIVEIGKELESYDALDTGVFRIGPALLRELAAVEAQQGDCSLSDGVQALARRGKFLAVDVGDVRWIDVDTPQALERAEAMLRVFGDALGDEPGAAVAAAVDPEALELFAPSWVRAAQPYREDHFAIAEKRTDVARLMSNENPFAPSPRVLAAIVETASRGNLYPGGAQALKTRLATRDGFESDNVILGAGSSELIDVIIRTFVAPGEEVVLSVPTFSMYEARTRVAGGIPVLVPMSEEHEHDISGIIRSVTERTKVLFLCTPNNPTGNRIDEEALRRLLRLGLPTVVDEAYVELGNGDSYAGLVHEFANAMVLRTFSKAYGLAGLRLGYLYAHPRLISLLERVKLPWGISDITLAAASAVLDDVAEFESRIAEIRIARAALAEGLSKLEGVRAVPSDGNFVLVDVSVFGVSAERFVQEVLHEGVLIRSLSVHHAAKTYVRITVGTVEQNARCLAAFERVAARLRRPGLANGTFWAAAGDAE
ncbi:MAG TPA: histidinol-phosphate transaminase [Polyangiaceae bacterium]|nr:histidinol-phosphate transaminase [Polyangiaceae bacterium]